MGSSKKLDQRLSENGITHWDFLRYCTAVSGAIGLGPSFGQKVLEAFASSERPTLLWLHFSECKGCREAVSAPTFSGLLELIFDNVSLDYHEAGMAAAGCRAEHILYHAARRNQGRFFCVVEGFLDDPGMSGIVRTVCPQASAVIAVGSCSDFSASCPAGFQGLRDVLGPRLKVPLIKLPGCPTDSIHLAGTLANYLLFGRSPELDDQLRPKFAYDREAHIRTYRHEPPPRGGLDTRPGKSLQPVHPH